MYALSEFSNVSDYLPILNGVLYTDLVFLLGLIFGIIKSKKLQLWYRELSLSAVIADVLIIFIVIIIARFIYPHIFAKYSLWKFLLVAVGVQVAHDLLFYKLFSAVKRGKSRILDIFKDYGKEKGSTAIIADSLMMISSILIASYLKDKTLNSNIIILIVGVYLIPYMVYTV